MFKILSSLAIFLFGLAIGSFLNVLIYRMPRGISIIKPGSFCPKCKKPIKWHENIPVFSFILLAGRCSVCKKTISIQYPIVEILTGSLFLWSFYKYQLHFDLFFHLLFFSSLIVISGIDFSYQLIPDIISIPGIFLAIIRQLLKDHLLIGLSGIFFGGGLIFLMRVVGGWTYKKEVMGLGDVYLTAMIGAFVGFPLVIPSIFIAALVGAIFGIIYLTVTKQQRESPIPFGPFLSLGAIIVIMFQAQIVKILSRLSIFL